MAARSSGAATHRSSIALGLCAALLAAGCSGGGGGGNGATPGGGATYTISGTVSGAASVTVTLSAAGAADRTTTTGAGGTYSFSAVANGGYTVTPSKASYTMSPLSTVVAVSGADRSGVNFTATAAGGATHAITGAITKVASVGGGALSGVTVTLSSGGSTLGAALTTATGGYSFAGLADGSYTVTPALAGYAFTPAAPSVAVSGADATRDFTADGANTVSGTVSTGWGSKLQGVSVALSGGGLAKPAAVTGADGVYTFTGVPNGSFTVTPTLSGYAFTPAAPLVALSGDKVQDFSADGAYTLAGTITNVVGAPLAGVAVALSGGGVTKPAAVTGADGSFSFAVPDGTFTLTPALTGYSFTPAAPSVAMNAASKTQDFAAAGAYTISGTVTTGWGAPLQSATIALASGGRTRPSAATTDAAGAYTISGVPDGSFTVTPTLAGYVFTPAAPTVVVSGGSQTRDFSANGAYTISGTVSGVSVGGVSIALSGGGVVKPAAVSASDGTYAFTGIPNGSYTLTPTKAGYSIAPASPTVVVSGADSVQNFTSAAGPSYSIGGTLTGAGSVALSGMTVRLSGSSTAITQTDGSGRYAFGGLTPGGSYTVAPAVFGYTFTPTPRTYASLAATVANADFATTQLAPATFSGTLSYAGTRSGPVYVWIQDGPIASGGTGLPAQAGPWSGRAFTVRNMPTTGGNVTVWMDTLGTGHFNAAADPSVTYYTSSATVGALALQDPVGVPTVASGNALRINEVVPFDQGAVIAFDTPRDAQGHEAADSYRIYWNTSSTVDSTHTLGTLVVPAGSFGGIVKGLANGNSYWFRVVAYAGAVTLGQGQSVATTSPTVIGAPAGSATVSGTVTYPTLPSPTALYVVAARSDSGKHYVQRIASPSGTQSAYSLQVPPGTYQLFTVVDVGDDGSLPPGDPMPESQSWAGTLTLSAGANAGPTLAVAGGKSVATVFTRRWADHGTTGTHLSLDSWSNLSPARVLPLKASVTGPGIPGGVIDLAPDAWGGGGALHVSGLQATEPASPVVGDSYAFTVTYTDGSYDAFSPTVTGLFGSAPNLSSPAEGATGVSTTPAFAWSAPASPPGAYGYALDVGPQDGSTAWGALLPSGTTSASYDSDGTATAPQLGAFATQQWQLTALDVNGNQAQAWGSFTTGAAQLASFDPLSGSALDGGRWQTPQFSRSVVGGQAVLSAAMDAMQGRLDGGVIYMNNLTVNAAGHRVTTFQSAVTVPSASASRGGTSTANLQTGVRLNYQPAANRIPSFPGQYLNLAAIGLELFDDGNGPKVRARAYHCDNGTCSSFSDSGFVWSSPAPFVQQGTDAVADAAYDTTYTFTLAMNESTGILTWTVAGGAFGAGTSGTVDVSSWVAGAGMQLNSPSNGFSNATIIARVFDESVDGGGHAAVTAAFDNVTIGLDGAAAALYDDFSTMGSADSTGFSAAKWQAPTASALLSGGALHLRSACTTPATAGCGETTAVNALYPATFNSWQVDATIVSDSAGGGATDQVQIGGMFAYDGSSAGGANNPIGGILANVMLKTAGASYWIARCTAAANGGCSTYSQLASGALPPGSVSLGVGTTHTLFEQWDPTSMTFTFRLDDGTPVHVTPALTRALPPWVPSRYLQTSVSVPSGAAAGTTASFDAAIANVQTAP